MVNLKSRTIYCRDNLDVLRGINSKSVDLIYLDPPFNKKKVFTAPIGSSAEGAEFSDIFREEDIKNEWLDEIRQDHYALHEFLNSVKNIEGRSSYNFFYLAYMAIRLIECQRVLRGTGSVYLHCDPTMSHYLKLLMDCIFGEKHFQNEIIWRIGWVSGYKTQKRGWIRNHDTILYYLKTAAAAKIFNKSYIPYPPDYVRRDGKKPTGAGVPIEDTWNCSSADVLDSIMIKSFSKEKTGYPTQKPLALLQRIIRASSEPGDMVLDPFCGCATTLVAAESLQRDWVGVDVSYKAFELVKERLGREVPADMVSGEPEFQTAPPKRTDIDTTQANTKFVYVIPHKNYPGEYKVGIAKDVKERLGSYQTSDPGRSFKLEFSFRSPHYQEIEKFIHAKYDNRHEWVSGDLRRIIEDIKGWD
ncbi:MAG: GIY-YIG nuclease family protein [Cellvibrionales bacterium]|nr:GIY-YIG nuclease family protein [Cellvibrionales bacterium]